MALQPSHIQTNDQMDILAGEWTITCEFELSKPHTVVFQYIAPVISFFYCMQLKIDDEKVYTERLFFPAIHSDECVFHIEGVPCVFSYKFGILGREIRLIVGEETVLTVNRGLRGVA